MPSKKPQLSGNEVLKKLSQGIRTAVTRPNIWGYHPHEKQLDFHSNPAQTRLFLGGNRSGKTTGGATEAVWWLMGNHPYRQTPRPPVAGRAIAVDFMDGVEKIIKPEISRWLPPSSLKNGSWMDSYENYTRTLTLENGSTLEFLSYEQDIEKHAGTSRDFVWFDEEPPQPIYEENLLRLLDKQGHMWMTMTPLFGMNWVYDGLYLASRTNPMIYVVEVDMAHNPHLNQGEIQSFLATLDDDAREARQHGKFVALGGLIYKNFGDKHIIDPIIPPHNWLHFTSMDHGLNNPTAWLWIAVGPDGEMIVYDEHYEAQQLVGYHAQMVIQRESRRQPIISYRIGDPSIVARNPITGTSVQLEYSDYGLIIAPGNNDVNGGINRVARYLEGVEGKPRLHITRNCVNLIEEMSRYRWGSWATKKMGYDRNKKEEPHKKNDHACDALRYAVASRPILDDGSGIPDINPREHVAHSVAVNPEKPVYDNLDGWRDVGTQWRDSHLGSEW